MPVARRGSEFRVKLRRHEPGMARQLDDLDQPVLRETRKLEPGARVGFEVVVVEFVAMPMALGDQVAAIELTGQRAGLQMHILRAQSHGAAEVRALIARLHTEGTVLPFGDQGDDPMRRGAVEFGTVILGSLTFTGSLMAAGKLQELLPQRPITYKGQNIVNLSLLAISVALAVLLVVDPGHTRLFPLIIAIPLVFGVLMIVPIGGADMPTVI